MKRKLLKNDIKTEKQQVDFRKYSFWFGQPTNIYDGTEYFDVETPMGLQKKEMPAWQGYEQYQEGDNALLLGYRKTNKGMKPVKYRLDYPAFKHTNNNVLIIGGAGSGKTWHFTASTIASMNESYIVTDTAGELYEEFGQMLADNGYTVLRYAPHDGFHSDTYNPFDYMYDNEGSPDSYKVDEFINIFFKDSYELGRHGGDPFWNKTAKAFMTFLVYYMLEFVDAKDRGFYTLLQLTQKAKQGEEPVSMTHMDEFVAAARMQNPYAKCFEYYDIFAIAPAKTRNSIIISIGVELSPFAMDSYRYVTSNTKRNINLYDLGNKKTALFIITSSATTASVNAVLSTLLIRHAGNCLFKSAELNASKWVIKEIKSGNVIEGGFESNERASRRILEMQNSEGLVVRKGECALPIPTRFIINSEFGTTISTNPAWISVARRYKISVSLTFQCVEQISALYDFFSPSELNCDIHVYLGSSSEKTREYISKCLGNTLVCTPLSSSVKIMPLMSTNMLAQMESDKCIVMIRGMNPMLLNKIFPVNESWYKDIGSVSKRSFDNEWLDKHYPPVDVLDASDISAPAKEITIESLAAFLGITDKKQITKKEILHAVLDIIEP